MAGRPKVCNGALSARGAHARFGATGDGKSRRQRSHVTWEEDMDKARGRQVDAFSSPPITLRSSLFALRSVCYLALDLRVAAPSAGDIENSAVDIP